MAVLKGAERPGSSMALADHLREARNRLLICLGTVAFMLIPAWFLYPWMVDLLNAPYCRALTNLDPETSCKFLETNLLAPFTLRMRVAGLSEALTVDVDARSARQLGLCQGLQLGMHLPAEALSCFAA